MADISLLLNAVDTLMFRDGRPFNQADAGASRAVSVFPPFPPTFVGAIRYSLWKAGSIFEPTDLGHGVNWQKEDKLGALSFNAPLLQLKDEILYPCPAHILKSNDDKLIFLKPSDKPLDTDNKLINLPVPIKKLEGLKSLEGYFITQSGLEDVLKGQLPNISELKSPKDLYSYEERVGIARNNSTRQVQDGSLYLASHIRPQEDLNFRISFRCTDTHAEHFEQSRLLPLAGEHRFVSMKKTEIKTHPKSEVSSKFFIYFLSPCYVDKPQDLTSFVKELGTIKSAVIPKPVTMGGWDSAKKTALPLKQLIPAGSIIFIEGENPTINRLGKATEWGFGHILFGQY